MIYDLRIMIRHAKREVIYNWTIYKLPFRGVINDNVNENDDEGRKRPKMTRMLILNAEREEF